MIKLRKCIHYQTAVSFVINIDVESSDESDIDIGSETETGSESGIVTVSEDVDGHICAGIPPLQ